MTIDLDLREKLLLWFGHVKGPIEEIISDDQKESIEDVLRELEGESYLSKIGDGLELTEKGEKNIEVYGIR